MILARVIGTLWATRKHPRLGQHKLMLVRPHAAFELAPDVDHLVVVDTVQAGVGDDVVVCLGAPAREALGHANFPVDAAIMAVVDRCQFRRDAFAPGAQRPLRFARSDGPRAVEWT
ncbi:MAG: EutN/CcmL family microcompartment protein [Pseudomonadota bacterium]